MKHYLILLLVLTECAASAQKYTGFNAADSEYMRQQQSLTRCHGPNCSFLPPGTVILPGAADKRFKEFNRKATACNLGGLAKEAVYSAEGSLALLTMLTNSKSNYDGFRVYFVTYPNKNSVDSGSDLVPTNQYNKLALIFLPTWRTDPESDVHPDDTSNCMIIRADSVEHISTRYASLWINKAEKTVLYPMEKNQRKTDPKFLETRSLWYDIVFVEHQPIGHNGLIDILKCRMGCGYKSIHAKYGGFIRGSNKHQLSMVFMIGSDPAESYVSLWSADLSSFAKHYFKVDAMTGNSGGSDTGKPCPPPSPCAITVGAALSNQ